jgi:hypothetical protein
MRLDCKGGLTPTQHVADCCLGVQAALHQGNNWQHVFSNVAGHY